MSGGNNLGDHAAFELPEGIQCLSHQVSGHIFSPETANPKAGMLECQDGTILKACQNNKRGMRELQFYKQIFQDGHPEFSPVRRHVAGFHGSLTLDAFPDETFMKLEDITKRFKKPCIMDVKMGAITWDPEADSAKISREKAKYPYADEIGFHLLGMRVYDKTRDQYSFTKKQCFRSLSPEEILPKGLAKFVNGSSEHFHRCTIHSFLHQLHHLRDWVQTQTTFHFFASSLLFVYEGNRVDNPADCRFCAGTCIEGPGPSCLKNCANMKNNEENGAVNCTVCAGKGVQEPKPSCQESSSEIKQHVTSTCSRKHKICDIQHREKCAVGSATCSEVEPESKIRKQNGCANPDGKLTCNGLRNGSDENKEYSLEHIGHKVPELGQKSSPCTENGATSSLCDSHSINSPKTCQKVHISKIGHASLEVVVENNNRAGASHKSLTKCINTSITNGVTKDEVDQSVSNDYAYQFNKSVSPAVNEHQCKDASTNTRQKTPDGIDCSFADVRMIDFTHVYPANGSRDENYSFALNSLISHFEALLETKRVLV